eukprot:gene361-419_t
MHGTSKFSGQGTRIINNMAPSLTLLLNMSIEANPIINMQDKDSFIIPELEDTFITFKKFNYQSKMLWTTSVKFPTTSISRLTSVTKPTFSLASYDAQVFIYPAHLGTIYAFDIKDSRIFPSSADKYGMDSSVIMDLTYYQQALYVDYYLNNGSPYFALFSQPFFDHIASESQVNLTTPEILLNGHNTMQGNNGLALFVCRDGTLSISDISPATPFSQGDKPTGNVASVPDCKHVTHARIANQGAIFSYNIETPGQPVTGHYGFIPNTLDYTLNERIFDLVSAVDNNAYYLCTETMVIMFDSETTKTAKFSNKLTTCKLAIGSYALMAIGITENGTTEILRISDSNCPDLCSNHQVCSNQGCVCEDNFYPQAIALLYRRSSDLNPLRPESVISFGTRPLSLATFNQILELGVPQNSIHGYYNTPTTTNPPPPKGPDLVLKIRCSDLFHGVAQPRSQEIPSFISLDLSCLRSLLQRLPNF